jgi:hypothetical protein
MMPMIMRHPSKKKKDRSRRVKLLTRCYTFRFFLLGLVSDLINF